MAVLGACFGFGVTAAVVADFVSENPHETAAIATFAAVGFRVAKKLVSSESD